ncbi:MAG: hypothetical protein R3195_20055 [Gemmatimonadota bacterium]|nr:hypothetical protein [Gemmatimonadota bacterium]
MGRTLPLSPAVRLAAREFFGDALDLEPVRVIASPLASLTGRAFVTWNTIHWPGPPPERPADPTMRTLIHELAHCWQYQSGRHQLLRGVIEQTLYTLFGWWMVRLGLRPLYDPYDFGGAAGVARARGLHDFRLEAQAAIVDACWASRAHSGDDPFAADLARLCREAGIGAIREPWPAPEPNE